MGLGGVGTVEESNRTSAPFACAAAVVPFAPRCTFTKVLPNLDVYAICSLSMMIVPALGKAAALSTAMLATVALIAEVR